MKISLIIPCYNCEKYISDLLHSINEQANENISVICVDDGSTDSTFSILNGWKNKALFNLTIIRTENGGVSRARNIGIQNCKTQYLAFCDADDLLSQDYFDKLLRPLASKSVDASYSYLTRDYKIFKKHSNNGSCIIENQNETMNKFLYEMGKLSFACFVYKTSIIKENNLHFDEFTKYGEDREFAWKYLCNCNKIAFLNENLYYYRPNEKSATESEADWRRTDVLFAVRRIEEYMLKSNCSFYSEFKSFMYARCIWSVAKSFALSKNKTLFKRFIVEFDAKKDIKPNLKKAKGIVRFSTFFFLINPMLFYYLLGLYKK